MRRLILSAQEATEARWHFDSPRISHTVERTFGWRFICAMEATIQWPDEGEIVFEKLDTTRKGE